MMKMKTCHSEQKRWTDKEVQYLMESWGTKPITYIAKHLKRTSTSVIRKAERLKLGAYLNNGEYITYKQLLEVLHINYNSPNKLAWTRDRNFPLRKKKVVNSYRKIVYLNEFWEWAEKNQDMLDFSKLEYLILGKEPEWVDKKRKSDIIKANKIIITDWTTYEDNQLINLVKEYRYTTKELSNILHRTEGAIIKRLTTLNCKYRPLAEPKHNKWTAEELSILIKALKEESNWTAIQHLLPNHSEKAVKSRCYLLFKTQKLNEIKNLLSD